MLLPHVTPLILLPSREAAPNEVIYSGSGAFIDTGEKQLLITCEHVWQAFQEYLADHEEAVVAMSIGSEMPVINDLDVLAIDRSLDVAVLDLTGTGYLDESTKRFCRSDTWPPRRPEEGDLLVALGFPRSMHRETYSGATLQFRTVDIMDFVVSVSDRHIGLADEGRVREVINHLEDEVPPDFSLGGMSGCPAFVHRDQSFVFVGVVYEATETEAGILYATHADLITPSGAIDWGRVPN